jgi:hypothetical protein
MAVAGLVLGILPVFGGILGIVFGLVGRSRARKSGRKGAVMGTWGAALGALWLVGIVVAVAVAAITAPERVAGGGFGERGRISWQELQPGDCVESDPGDGAFEVTVTPCSSPHEVEVFDRFDATSEDIRITRTRCDGLLNAYVGAPSGARPTYRVNALQLESDAVGNPAVCMLLAPGKADLGSSVRGSWPWQPSTPTAVRPTSPTSLSGHVALEDLRVGDCIGSFPSGEVFTLPLVPCGWRHAGQVFDVHSLGSGGYPGDADVDRIALGRCRVMLPKFVDAPAGKTGYSINYYSPTRESWAAGDTRVLCVLDDPQGDLLRGDAKGAGRNRS